MSENHASGCQSCGMAIESGTYCRYCTDENGNLQSFAETVTRMSQFMKRENATLSDAEAEAKTLEHMATMPAWREHPDLLARRGG